ncbi:MAG TPA: NAD(P)H-dependent glycerol-3-phosphate dehydrogenase, partial [Acidimicrobiales bacterium]|nr:NAD(P)H-dependent glycerol-3-phosphate dehydrogenase [Acidimicrobiales bacterium]
LDEIVGGMHMVAEGIKSAGPLVGLARAHGVEMPIAEQVVAVLYGGQKARDVIGNLMSRQAKPELHGIPRR